MLPLPKESNKILIAPLNWGLGHATRAIPIIQYCIESGKEVIIASDGHALSLLQETFPTLKTISLPSYNVTYKAQSLWGIVFRNLPNVFLAIIREHFLLKKIIGTHQPHFIISDSRFGFWTKKIPCGVITHQLKLLSSNKLLGFFLNLINSFFLNKFDFVWVPDSSDHKLSGILSKNKSIKNVNFLDPISRLEKYEQDITQDISIILSGPEPARSHLEQKLISLLKQTELSIVLVRGTNDLATKSMPKHWIIKDRLGTKEINDIILSSKNIISRSGYTSIMDYYLLEKSAILVPTPGQSEQEYLGEYLNGKFGFNRINEQELTLPKIKSFLKV